MGFRTGSFARVFAAENKGKYSVCKISISRKDKENGEYKTDFQDSFVRFVGDAHKKISEIDIPEKGVSIKIASCDVTNSYVAEKKQTYVNYAVFGFELPDGDGGNSESKSKKFEAKKSTAKTTKKAVSKAVEEEEILSDDDLPF